MFFFCSKIYILNAPTQVVFMISSIVKFVKWIAIIKKNERIRHFLLGVEQDLNRWNRRSTTSLYVNWNASFEACIRSAFENYGILSFPR